MSPVLARRDEPRVLNARTRSPGRSVGSIDPRVTTRGSTTVLNRQANASAKPAATSRLCISAKCVQTESSDGPGSHLQGQLKIGNLLLAAERRNNPANGVVLNPVADTSPFLDFKPLWKLGLLQRIRRADIQYH